MDFFCAFLVATTPTMTPADQSSVMSVPAMAGASQYTMYWDGSRGRLPVE